MITAGERARPEPAAPSRAASLIGFVLTHPVVMRIKRPLRDAAWMVKGAGLRNPPVPERVTSILFVCLGNICRSPFGALLTRRLLEDAGRHGVTVASAGIRPSQAARSPLEARTVASQYGLSLDSHVPQPLTREMVGAHDIVVVMEASQWHEVRASYPEFRDRIFLLALYDQAARNAYERFNIADPFGQPAAAFDACYVRMDRAIRRWLASVPFPGGIPVSRR